MNMQVNDQNSNFRAPQAGSGLSVPLSEAQELGVLQEFLAIPRVEVSDDVQRKIGKRTLGG